VKGWKAKRILLLFLAVSTAALSGCIPTEQQLRMEKDIQGLKDQIATLERRLVTLREGRIDESSQRIETLARQQADQQARIDGLRVEFQSIVGRLDDAATDRNQIHEDLSLVKDDVDLRLADLADRISTLSPPPPPPPQPEPEKKQSPEDFYKEGLALIREKGDFTAGREILLKFLKRFPKNELEANALYWIGESYYGEKKYESAIGQFQDIIDRFPKHPKAAAALLKQALAFQAMGNNSSAQTLFQRVVDVYPDAEEAKKAHQYLEKK